MIVKNTIKSASQILKKNYIESYLLDAELILSNIMNVKKEFLLLNDRYLLGSGIRIGFNNNKLSTTYLGIGFMVEKETYNLDIDNEKSLLRSTNYIKNNIALSSNIDLSNTCYFQIASDDLNDYRILYDGGLDFYVNDYFAFTIELNYRYDNDPHGGLGISYIQISNGVSFNF